jgi:hypothetical protein
MQVYQRFASTMEAITSDVETVLVSDFGGDSSREISAGSIFVWVIPG